MTYRCTRNEPYRFFTPGYGNIKERQGYYIEAKSREEAIAKMQSKFWKDRCGFTAESA